MPFVDFTFYIFVFPYSKYQNKIKKFAFVFVNHFLFIKSIENEMNL